MLGGSSVAIVYLFKFKKRNNSTKKPGLSDGEKYGCEIFEPFTVTAPTLLFKATGVFEYNYTFIPEFNRYYFVKEWTFENGLWKATTEEDFLSSWKTQILNSEQYVERSTMESDEYIYDHQYTNTYNNRVYLHKIIPYYAGNVWWGLSDNVSVNYRTFLKGTWFGIGTIKDNQFYMQSNGYLIALKDTYVSLEVVMAQMRSEDVEKVRLSEFVSQLYMLPQSYDDVTSTTYATIFVGAENDFYSDNQSLTGTHRGKTWQGYDLSQGGEFKKVPRNKILTTYFRVPTKDILQEPFYLNAAPTKAFIIFRPFGKVEIDLTTLKKLEYLSIVVQTDVASGNSELSIVQENGLVPIASANIAVNVELTKTYNTRSQYERQTVNQLTNIAQGVLAPPTVEGTLKTAANLTSFAMRPYMQTGGALQGNAGNILVDATPSIYITRFEPVQFDNERFGSPLFKKRVLSKLANGFVKCIDAKILDNEMLLTEQDAVEQALNNGTYLE